MEQLKNKKISFIIILFSVLMLIFGIISKDYNGTRYSKKHKSPPLDLFDVSIFGWDIPFKNYILFFIITLGIGIYLFVYSSDIKLKEYIKIPWFYNGLKSRYGRDKVVQTNLVIDKTTEDENSTEGWVKVIALYALIFTFYVTIQTAYSLWFFIILSYFYQLTWKPKSITKIIVKAIFYPLIFLLIFGIFSRVDSFKSSGFIYTISKHFIPYLICVVIIFFTQKYKLNNETKFSFRNGLFRVSLLSLLVAFVSLILGIYSDSSF